MLWRHSQQVTTLHSFRSFVTTCITLLYSIALFYCTSRLHSICTHFLHSFASCFALFYCSHLISVDVALILHSFLFYCTQLLSVCVALNMNSFLFYCTHLLSMSFLNSSIITQHVMHSSFSLVLHSFFALICYLFSTLLLQSFTIRPCYTHFLLYCTQLLSMSFLDPFFCPQFLPNI